ncbi:hypothetical protein FGADI_9039 [Fusarium gaditjirri]|uniref:PLC-like phosphodiesterase n=1 Tax=Fusarium gaditjirri TaxID=282569 RepID=A0A8H4T115_9HYPO|nr:hypothetical protein FGADI_9039 [Fusarium gaditjirri]
MLYRVLLCISALAGFAIAAPPPEMTSDALEVRSDTGGSDVRKTEDHDLQQLERRWLFKIGSYFLIVNATPWNMTLVGKHSYQMKQFDFPKTIKAGTSKRIYIQGIGRQDDAGEATYAFKDLPGRPDLEFKYSGRYGEYGYPGGPGAGIQFKKLKTLNNKHGSFHQLDWYLENNVPFIIASSEENPRKPSVWPWLVSTNPPEDWMHSIYPRIACLKLRELAMPGTHNSGMSRFHRGSFFGAGWNTKNQMLNVSMQLKYGARYIDFRPSKTGGKWAAGHFGFDCGNWHGGNGEYLEDVIDSLNEFTRRNQELIILHLDHGLNSDTFKGNKRAKMSQEEWEDVMKRLERINYRVKNRGNESDLTSLRVSDFIPGRPAVIIVVDDYHYKKTPKGTPDYDSQITVDTSAFADKGIFNGSQFPQHDDYANTNNQKKMVADQMEKMKRYRKSPESKMFLLSWFLTQRLNPIIFNAVQANRALIELLWPRMSRSTYPNIISVDAYPDNRDLVALAMAINYHFAPRCEISS